MSLQTLFQTLITQQQFLNQLFRCQGKVTDLQQSQQFLKNVCLKADKYIQELNKEYISTSKLEDNQYAIQRFEYESQQQKTKKMKQELKVIKVQLNQLQKQISSHLVSDKIRNQLKQLLKQYQEQEQVKQIFNLYNKLQNCSRVDAAYQIDRDLPLQQQQVIAQILKATSQYLPKSFYQAFQNSQILIHQINNRVILSLKQALLLTAPAKIQQYYQLAIKLNIQNIAALQYLKLLAGDLKSFNFILKQSQNYQSILKDTFENVSTNFKAALASHNQRIRCSYLFGVVSKNVFRLSLVLFLQYNLKPSIRLSLNNCQIQMQIQILEIVMSQMKKMQTKLLLYDNEGLLQNFNIRWHVSAVLQNFIIDYEKYQQQHFRKTIRQQTNKLQKIVDYKKNNFLQDIKIKTKLSRQQLKAKIHIFNQLKMSESVELIYKSLQKALYRNTLISKLVNQDINARFLLKQFLQTYVGFIQQVIKKVYQFIPQKTRKTPIQPAYFQLISTLLFIKERAQIIYFNNPAIKGSSDFNDAKKKFQSIQDTLSNNIIQSLASLILNTNNKLKKLTDQDLQIYTKKSTDKRSVIAQTIIMENKSYALQIIRITNKQVSQQMIMSWAKQLFQLLTNFYSKLQYKKCGLVQLHTDLLNYQQFIVSLSQPILMKEFQQFKANLQLFSNAPQNVVKQYKKNLEAKI